MPKIPYYLTTAIAYPNGRPHIGFAYELMIADMLARWHELKGEDVFLLTGTDENAQKVAKAADVAGKNPKQFVDEVSAIFQELCTKLEVNNSGFIRTTDKKHVKTATEIFTKVFNKGLIYKGSYTGLYCGGCEGFKTEKDLKEGICPDHLKKPEQFTEENYLFKMSLFQEQIIKHIQMHPKFVQPESVRNEILNRLKEPLQDLSVSRTTIKWGIKVPQDNKHVIYVWFDALLNYISGIGYPTKKFQKYWSQAHHLIGRDIAWFHTVIWPAILLAADLPLPQQVFCHGMFTINGQKISKSLGNTIDPFELIKKYGEDPIRYTFLRDVPAGQDGDFSEKTLIERNNAELADALGNLLQRTSVLIQTNFQGTIPLCGELTEKEKELEGLIPKVEKLNELMDNYQWHHVIEQVWNYINKCNKYINDTQPWKVQDKARLGTILYTTIEHLRIISILIWPTIPKSAQKIAAQIGQEVGKLKDAKFKKTTRGKLEAAVILFKKIESRKEERQTKADTVVQPFAKLNIHVGEIEKVEIHPNAEKLYVLSINAGDKRTIVSGIRTWYQPQDLQGKKIVFVSNLKPATIRGVESKGMVLTAEKEGRPTVLEAPEGTPGEQVVVAGITPLSSEITIEEFKQIPLTTKDKKVIWNELPLRTKKGFVIADVPDGAQVR